ncbi:MAG: hypothetical protein OSB69_18005 [Alphaproteobacteria bacterium]|nr:hypothetical protein [Alphaproteobacteria bacterium]
MVSSWNQAGGAPTPQAEGLEDFRQLSSLHLVIEAIRHDILVSTDVSALLATLDVVSLVYRRGGVFNMTKEARDEVRQWEPLITATLARMGAI